MMAVEDWQWQKRSGGESEDVGEQREGVDRARWGRLQQLVALVATDMQ